jgi:hypothetical protein
VKAIDMSRATMPATHPAQHPPASDVVAAIRGVSAFM